MEEAFIIAIRKHRVLGYILSPYMTDFDPEKKRWIVKNMITSEDINAYNLTPEQEKLVAITSKYSDSEIFRIFGKRRKSKVSSVQEFYNKLDADTIKTNIRPYVENRMFKCLDVLKNTDIPVFFRESVEKNLYESDAITVNQEYAETVFNFIREEAELKYYLSVRHNGEEKNLTHKFASILTHDPCSLLLDDEIFIFKDIDGKKLIPFFKKEYVSVPKNLEKKYFETFIKNAIKQYRVNAYGFEIKHIDCRQKAILRLEKYIGDYFVLILVFQYGKYPIYPEHTSDSFVELKTDNENYYFEKILRDKVWERDIIQKLEDIGLQRSQNSVFFPGNIPKEDYALISWLNVNSAKIRDTGISFEQNHNFSAFYLEDYRLKMGVTKKIDWFDLHAVVVFDKYEIPFGKFKHHILENRREYMLPDGRIVLLPEEWFHKYYHLFSYGKTEGEHIYIQQHHFALLDIAEIDTNNFDDKSRIDISRFKELYEQTISGDISLPAGLNVKLRSYQKDGLAWMYFLYRNQFGGCLADDMGLGKTVQTLSLILKAKEEGKKQKTAEKVADDGQLSLFEQSDGEEEVNSESEDSECATSLIVMPTSLLHNWENEINKFAPALTVLKYIGQRKGLINTLPQYDIVLTSYGIVRNDAHLLKEYRFSFLILDESQYIKNPSSKIYQAVTEFNAQQKLVLTGTPIENSLSDLWAQLNFLNEGLLGSYNSFKEKFVTPIEKFKDTQQEAQLQKLIQPFLLRRKKSEVAKELPPVTEQIYYCEQTPEQKDIYEKYKFSIRNTILESIEDPTTDSSYKFQVLEGLLKLRQLANHPVLIDPEFTGDSGKFNEICRSIENIVAENHKLIIYSSFVKHLNIVEDFLNNQHISYSKLTGETANREYAVDRFQKSTDVNVFLISLKAGGVGLNLTAAEYVFMLDPWWNPAAENQAINRVHRIGQDKNIFVYRFITRQSIEEKILKLQNKKSELANTFVNSSNPFKELSYEQIKELLK